MTRRPIGGRSGGMAHVEDPIVVDDGHATPLPPMPHDDEDTVLRREEQFAATGIPVGSTRSGIKPKAGQSPTDRPCWLLHTQSGVHKQCYTTGSEFHVWVVLLGTWAAVVSAGI